MEMSQRNQCKRSYGREFERKESTRSNLRRAVAAATLLALGSQAQAVTGVDPTENVALHCNGTTPPWRRYGLPTRGHRWSRACWQW